MKRFTVLALILLLATVMVAPGCGEDPRFKITQVKFETSKGDFTVEVHPDWAPLGAARFLELVDAGFFTDCRFFRVIGGFMAQFGINGDPAVQAKWRDKNLQDEPVMVSNQRGYVTFAKGGPNSRTTQLFISYRDNGNLDGMGFPPFGLVMHSDMYVVDNLYNGYGEGAPSGKGPSQGLIQSRGNEYLKKDFPKLDYIKSARIVD